MSMFNNMALLTDSYKVTHWKQYPPKTQYVYSYLEARGGVYDTTLFFGLQYILSKYLYTPITQEGLQEAKLFWKKHFGSDYFNEEGWQHIIKEHRGYLPLKIHAVKEGTHVHTNNVLMTIENTDPKVPWLTNWMETLLMQVWYPITVATQSSAMKQTLLYRLKETGDPSLIDFKLHDFGFRGSTSLESAALGGAAHLVNFMGTDTSPGLILAHEHYSCDMAGFSIPAAEHSTITSWGKDRESEAYANMLEQFPSGLVAVVSDSYNIYNACSDIWGKELKDKILRRDGCLVIRPDSGEPNIVLPKILDILGKEFGYTKNDKGYKVLPDKIRLIQGDGIDSISLNYILLTLRDKGWSIDNIAFGSGGGLLQKVNRDTCKFAIKCSAICIDNVWHDVYKDPFTDSGKKSKRGKLGLLKDANNRYTTFKVAPDGYIGYLEPVFHNGACLRFQSFDDIRAQAKATVISTE